MTCLPSRPILRWHGGKWRIADWIIEHFPPHKLYVEPFGGGASILLKKSRALTEVYNDLDRDLVTMFRVARDRPLELARALSLTPYAREEYYGLYETTVDELETARRFISRSFMGMMSKGAVRKSGFDARTNPDGYTGRLRAFAELPDEVLAVAGRFLHVLIENTDALSLLRRYDRPDALIYLDPPYLPETRSGKIYNHEMTAADHKTLLTSLVDHKGMILLSGYSSMLYLNALQGWRVVETPSYTDSGAKRTELLWINPNASRELDRQGLPLLRVLEGGAV